ncbi:glycine C-acetyltransferase [Spirochaeta lutea]|uniref:2-amino-3-ketobutyrate coenzyme A ligase n=1 Tax=Spirochaeta lutea TaxID=1480694 RepID=A0A098R200_9SPIO|nr:glycine C-acetyltransferase [Spirochaeta lutea]KGE73791.1 2-amino-3-ketobutyrate CoA ligase [Spirochaeta lutea]
MNHLYTTYLQDQLTQIQEAGLWKDETAITGPQDGRVRVSQGTWINLCANNYLGLSNYEPIVSAAIEGLKHRGYGMSSVRFICGTQDAHKALESDISRFLGTEDTILYSSCFDANGGLFETLLGEEDAIISDELNHASIIDGIRLSKAKRYRYKNRNLADLQKNLERAKEEEARFVLIATDGVFSMDGTIAPLEGICELAGIYNALVMVDDSHAFGFYGPDGRGTPWAFGVQDSVDIVTGTLGKALGGASGGFTSGRKEIVQYLRQRSRPYLFSNSLAPPIVAGSRKALEILGDEPDRLERLWENTRYMRRRLTEEGFTISAEDHPIIPIMLGDAQLAAKLAQYLQKRGIFVVSFSFPVVPRGKARIRLQMSAAHDIQELEEVVQAFRDGVKQLT